MGFLRKNVLRHRAFSGLLAALLLTQLLFQLQLHLHHGEDDGASHGHHHEVDYHPVTDTHPPGHPDQENTLELKSTPEVIIKKSLDRDFSWVMAACVLMLAPVVSAALDRGWSRPRDILRYYLYYGLAPPARAPPAI